MYQKSSSRIVEFTPWHYFSIQVLLSSGKEVLSASLYSNEGVYRHIGTQRISQYVILRPSATEYLGWFLKITATLDPEN